MEDFYQHYRDLPIPDLVKVAGTPSDYMPEAVAAAEKILRERGVTLEQMATFAAFITICMYCVLKQLWLGWSLLLVHAVVFICMKLSLLRPYVQATFKITDAIRSRSLLAAALVGIAAMLF